MNTSDNIVILAIANGKVVDQQGIDAFITNDDLSTAEAVNVAAMKPELSFIRNRMRMQGKVMVAANTVAGILPY